MTDQSGDWYRVISLARSNAAQDLQVSNEILNICDLLSVSSEITKEQLSELNERLIKQALQLAENSKEINFAITRLAGVL